MEITKDITVNTSNLINKSELEIVYSGKLLNSNEIYIHYGYEPNSFEYKSQKLKPDNSIKIHLEKPGYFYFFFTDENGLRDNNNYKDYQLYIKTSNLIITENSSMKELPYRYFPNQNKMFITYYTSQSLKNTSKPQEIIIPKSFDSNSATYYTKIKNGYTLEPVKPVTIFNVTQALIPTENVSMVSTIMKNNKKGFFHSLSKAINKIILSIPKAFEKE